MKNVYKILLHMFIPQSINSDNLYELFKAKVLVKSNNPYFDNGTNPVMLIMNVNHHIMDMQAGVLVQYDSFAEIITDDGENFTEIGFTAIVFTAFSKEPYILTVLKKGKAYMELKSEVEMAIKLKEKKEKKKKK